MTSSRKISDYVLSGTTVILVAVITFITLTSTVIHTLEFRRTAKESEQTYIRHQRELLRSRTESAWSIIDHARQAQQTAPAEESTEGKEVDESDRKAKILAQLAAIKDQSGGYLFVGTWDGVSLLGPAASIGKNMWEVRDLDGVMVVQELIAAARGGGGYVQYRMPLETDEQQTNKLSYVLPVPQWQWYIGTGIAIDELDAILNMKHRDYLSHLIKTFFVNLILLLLLLFLVRRLLRKLYTRIDADIDTLDEYFEQISRGTTRPLDKKLLFDEFQRVASYTDTMVKQRERILSELHHSNKMDAIGQLAGGVAHDFNNALSGIIGAAELLKRDNLPAEKRRTYIDLILTAATRSANLTRKLLTFSRKKTRAMAVIDCQRIIEDTVSLLTHTINKNIVISIDNQARHTLLEGDDSQLQHAFLNLGINAAQAMPNGGLLTFSLKNRTLSEKDCHSSADNIYPGEYLEIGIQDTGIGMTEKEISQVFEPFYTTKEMHQGTGLGLTLVYATIQEHDGAVTLSSAPGAGTSFTICLPISEKTAIKETNQGEIQQGEGTILLIDDEPLVLTTVTEQLQLAGYRVLSAANGPDGIATFTSEKNHIDLVILDMIMPDMGGHEVFEQLRKVDPSIPVIIASGFCREDDLNRLKNAGVKRFLQKPLQWAELAEEVTRVLNKAPTD